MRRRLGLRARPSPQHPWGTSSTCRNARRRAGRSRGQTALPRWRPPRTHPGTPAASAARDQDVVRDQRAALPRRALVARDGASNSSPKTPSAWRGENVGHALANLAECLLCHSRCKVTNEVETHLAPYRRKRQRESRRARPPSPKTHLPQHSRWKSSGDLSHGVNGTVARANHACLVAGKGDASPKCAGTTKGTYGIAQVNGLDIVSANACVMPRSSATVVCAAL